MQLSAFRTIATLLALAIATPALAHEVRIPLAGHLVKVDTRTGQSMRWSLTSGWVPSEPQFVPRPGGVSEDDGVLLLAANEIAAEKSWLLVLDAKSLTELARLPAPIEVNTGLHNMFVLDAPSYPIKN